MNIILFTTSLPEELFQETLKNGKPANPSGQNFYHRFGHTIDTFASRRTITFAPSNKAKCKDSNVVLVKRDARRKLTIRNIVVAFSKAIADFKPDFLIATSLNLTMAKAAKILAKKHDIPLVFVLTDDPKNITGAKIGFRFLSRHYAKDADAYLALTKHLDKVYNRKGKPSFIFPGIVDPYCSRLPLVSGDYYYYGGALYEKDGVGSLIRAYLKSGTTTPLYLAGHGEMENEIKEACRTCPTLHFLGQITREDNASMEEHALALINPRWYKKSLDVVSVPSKMLEYLSLGHRVVSTHSSTLRPIFETDVYWLSDKGKDIENELTSLFEHNFQEVPICKGQEKAQSYFGYEELGERLRTFLAGL